MVVFKMTAYYKNMIRVREHFSQYWLEYIFLTILREDSVFEFEYLGLDP